MLVHNRPRSLTTIHPHVEYCRQVCLLLADQVCTSSTLAIGHQMIIRKHYGDFSKKMLRRKIDEMKITIVGAAGLVGKEFTRQLSGEHRALALAHNDLDITDAQAVKQVVFDWRPQLIINCAVLGVERC